ncbi:ABC transporter permease [Hydrocarboniclastica marina]|uniref:Iron ABC transporter permease n=1 Tax=Hydrocarboniclastica marina TaxID=2259620 RepID=A0A4P7XHB2_9ALTE|nr:iron ABC transporter permease [Hydrocarboniclastica marina]QCF25844.1 iron ABC transporter permease [Hydrocarboniclastica marina]
MSADSAVLSAPIEVPHLQRRRLTTRWVLAAVFVTFLIALPVASVFYLAVSPDENIWPHLVNTVLPVYVANTLLLLGGVGLLTFLIGVPTAWVVSTCEFPGRRIMEWALLLPFAFPAYVIAYVYTYMLDYAGPVQIALRELFQWQRPTDYAFPEIRSMGGAIIMLSLVLYPYVYLLARAAFLEQSPSLFAVSRSLGRSAYKTFLTVVLPIARPAIAVGLSLVLMEALNDFGTVDFFAVRSLTAGLFDTWLNLSNIGGAAQIAVTMLAFVVLLVTLERYSRRRQEQYGSRDHGQQLHRFELSGRRKFLCVLLCLTPVLLGFLLPASVLVTFAWQYFEQSWNIEFFRYSLNSLMLAAFAAISTLSVGLLLAYSRRLQDTRLMRTLIRFSSLGYAMPGAVIAVGVIIPLAAFDNWLDLRMEQWFDVRTGLLLSGTVFAMVYAYTVRFLVVATGSLETGLQRITPSMDMASRSLGFTPGQTLWRVHLPMLRTSLITAALVVFVDTMKELPATLILRPFNFETLATHVYQLASDERLEQSALSALFIVLAGIVPVIVLSRNLTRQAKT